MCIARAIVNRPPILICDEPTGNLDPAISLGIMKLLERINRTGTTVIVATHDREMVDSMRRRVIALDRGNLTRDQDRGCTVSMSSFFYFLKESLTGFTRNLSTALGSIVTIFLSLLIIGIFLVGGSVVNNVVKSVEQEVNITVWIADDASSSGCAVAAIRHQIHVLGRQSSATPIRSRRSRTSSRLPALISPSRLTGRTRCQLPST